MSKYFIKAEGVMWAMKGMAHRRMFWYEWPEALWKGWEIWE